MKNKKSHFRKIVLLLTLVVGLFAIVQFSSIKDEIVRDQSSSVNQTQDSDQSQHQQIQLPVEATENPIVEEAVEDEATVEVPINEESTAEEPVVERVLSFQDHLANQAEKRLQSDVTYDGRYLKIAYPMGDVPENIGVCTDVVIRSFRGLGVDLQQRVHEDMKRNFRSYPKKWKLTKPDPNIDHRRVPNLMTYFERAGASLAITDNPLDYYAGDIVAWDLSKGRGEGNGKVLLHIGIVSNYVSELTSNPLIITSGQVRKWMICYSIIK